MLGARNYTIVARVGVASFQPPASMAIVDAKPDAASLFSVLGKWPDDVVDAVEAWDSVVELQTLASTSSWLVVVGWNRVSS